MYVCMYGCMYVCMYVWMYVCMYVCIYSWLDPFSLGSFSPDQRAAAEHIFTERRKPFSASVEPPFCSVVSVQSALLGGLCPAQIFVCSLLFFLFPVPGQKTV